jgi:arsenate reductase
MAEGFLKSFDNQLVVESAGTEPASHVNPYAIKVMSELGIDISKNKPKLVDQFINDEWDYVITVCDNAKETCPAFFGKVKHRLHIGFEDPAEAKGTEEFILNEFRRIRDLIKTDFEKFYTEQVSKKQN